MLELKLIHANKKGPWKFPLSDQTIKSMATHIIAGVSH